MMITLYSTWPDIESAEAGARLLIGENLAACANIVAGARSIFRWDGAIQSTAEAVMFAKTTAEAAARACAALRAAHPYDVPCIVALPLQSDGSNAEFLAWVGRETAAAT